MWTSVVKILARLLQVLIEACIGLAKQWLKQHQKVIPNDAYESMQKLADLGMISGKDLLNWRKVIGMRNAIVHDYLNLDAALLKAVIESRQYIALQRFVEQMAER